jgi:AAA family ATP:ADP antiporter
MRESFSDRTSVYAALFAAGAMITHQVAGKAARDALFLSVFGISGLPTMLVASAVFSTITGLAFARALRSLPPRRMVPIGFLASAALLVLEWLISFFSMPVAVVGLYLHMGATGSALISGFWSVLNERFDPHSARREFGRIAAGGTLGGLLGGLMAGLLPPLLTTTAFLLFLAALHAICAGITRVLAGEDGGTESRVAHEETPFGLKAFGASPYLRNLASLVLLGTVSAALLDYMFKAYAAAKYQSGADLLQFFALFYTGTGLATFLLQTTVGQLALRQFGLASTIATLPFSVAAGATATLLAPGLASAGIARGAEAVMRSSLFRAGYELLYTPVPQTEKRLAKPVIDVVVERVGDAAGGVLINVVLFWNAGVAMVAMTILAILIAVTELVLTAQLNRGYVKALEYSLLHRNADVDDPSNIQERTTRHTYLRTLGVIPPAHPAQSAPLADAAPSTPPMTRVDPGIQRLLDLRSGDPERVRKALQAAEELDELWVPQIIRLLAWGEVSEDAVRRLSPVASSITGQLVDALTDSNQEFAIRRRIPRVLSACSTQRAADGLVEGLSDKRFEVRLQCGRALVRMRDVNPGLKFDADLIFELAVKETTMDKEVWLSQSSSDDEERPGTLDHIFCILSLVLPSEPLGVAYKGLRTRDRQLWGTSLEYLESVLPEKIRHAIRPLLGVQFQV